MKPFTDQDCPALATLVAVVAHSQIVVAKPAGLAPALPAGFDATDIAVLDWIVAEGRRLGHGLVRM
jgi:hypothetical protein